MSGKIRWSVVAAAAVGSLIRLIAASPSNADDVKKPPVVMPTPQEMEAAKRKLIEGRGTRPGPHANYQTPTPQPPPSNWIKIKADNGAWGAIDSNSIEAWSTGGAYAIICISDDGGPCTFLQMTRVIFDCQGHFTAMDEGGIVLPAPPQSLGGALATIACARR